MHTVESVISLLPPIPVDSSTPNTSQSQQTSDTAEQQAKAIVYNPTLNGKFVGKPLPGCVTPAPGYPYLQSFDVSAKLENVSVNIFGSESKKASVVLMVRSQPADIASAANHVGRVVYVEYPYQRPALVTAVIDGKFKYAAGGVKQQLSDQELRQYHKDAQYQQHNWLISKAVEVGQVNVLLYVRRFTQHAQTGRRVNQTSVRHS